MRVGTIAAVAALAMMGIAPGVAQAAEEVRVPAPSATGGEVSPAWLGVTLGEKEPGRNNAQKVARAYGESATSSAIGVASIWSWMGIGCSASVLDTQEKNLILTDAHCITNGIDSATGRWSITEDTRRGMADGKRSFIPAYDPGARSDGASESVWAPYGVWKVVDAWVPADWEDPGGVSGAPDIALLRVAARADGKNIGDLVQGFPVATSKDEVLGKPGAAVGYPEDAPFDGKHQYAAQLVKMETEPRLSVSSLYSRDWFWGRGAKLSGGGSGSPLLVPNSDPRGLPLVAGTYTTSGDRGGTWSGGSNGPHYLPELLAAARAK